MRLAFLRTHASDSVMFYPIERKGGLLSPVRGPYAVGLPPPNAKKARVDRMERTKGMYLNALILQLIGIPTFML